MINRSALAAALVSAVILAGCAASGAKVSEQQLTQMKVGQTTWNDMVSVLGQPTSATFNSAGTRTAIYTYTQVTTRPETFIPYVGAFVGGADTKADSVMLTFGQDGKLQNYQGSTTAMGTGTGLEAGTTPERTDAQPRR